MTQQTIGITGGAGSLGRAFIRLLRKDHDILVIDNNEWAVAELRQEFPDVRVKLADFDSWHYDQDPVDTMIHCGAYKHVDLGEENPHSFIENNLTKTGHLFAECYKHGVDILFISTDKAVEPISTYGFTKALGERLAWQYGGSVARLGNILNSTGSVIPTWEDAIANNQPITITDESMTRYVIEDVDAVMQIWGGYLEGDRLIVPSMGEPQRLMDILKEVLERHGYADPEEYSPGVTVIGKRLGEKTHEKLRWDFE